MASRRTFYAMIAAGAAFIVIGIASAVNANIPVSVSVDGQVSPGKIDLLKPDMNVKSTANVSWQGQAFSVKVTDPDNVVIESQNATSSYHYNLVAQKQGVYLIETRNTGNETDNISGTADTKSSPLGFAAPLLLAVTGIIMVGLSLRFRQSS